MMYYNLLSYSGVGIATIMRAVSRHISLSGSCVNSPCQGHRMITNWKCLPMTLVVVIITLEDIKEIKTLATLLLPTYENAMVNEQEMLQSTMHNLSFPHVLAIERCTKVRASWEIMVPNVLLLEISTCLCKRMILAEGTGDFYFLHTT